MFDKLDDMLIHYEELMLMLGGSGCDPGYQTLYQADERTG